MHCIIHLVNPLKQILHGIKIHPASGFTTFCPCPYHLGAGIVYPYHPFPSSLRAVAP
jgi:hypothetical protein